MLLISFSFSKDIFTLQFSRNVFNYRKIWLVKGVNSCFNILCIFPAIICWHQSIFFLSFSLNPRSVRFQNNSRDQTFRYRYENCNINRQV